MLKKKLEKFGPFFDELSLPIRDIKKINMKHIENIQSLHKELTTVFEKTDLDLHECLDMLDKYLDISNKYLKSAIEELKTSNM